MYIGDARFGSVVLATVMGVLVAAGSASAQKPDFSGNWELDVEASDDTESQILGGAGQDTTTGMTRLQRTRLLERLIRLARALDEVEIEQTERDLKIFDRDDNVRIYYLDGDERLRQMPWGASLDVVAKWEGSQITVFTEGDEIGKVVETFGMEGRQLVYIVRIQNDNFANEIVIRNYYDRSN